jgi:hypothetical protein
MKKSGHIFLMIGLCWFGLVLGLMFTNIVVRGLPLLHELAEFLDKLPPKIGTPIFLLLWDAFLFGWLIPLALGILTIRRQRRQSQRMSASKFGTHSFDFRPFSPACYNN